MGLALLASPALLAGCGFSPVYGNRAATATALQQVLISPIPDREGQILRNALIDRLNPRGMPGNPRYRLDVTLSESLNRLAVARDDSLVRGQISIRAQYQLIELATNQVALSGQSRALNSYNVGDQQLAAVVIENTARSNALQEVAQDIATRLSLFIDQTG